MGNGVTTQHLNDIERGLIDVAVKSIEAVYRGDLLAILCQDQRGMFWTLRPGVEIEIMRVLADTNWKRMVRVAEEHAP